MIQVLSLLLLVVSSLTAQDFNPRPKWEDIYLKKGRHSFGGWANWSCSTLVFRKPLDVESAGPGGWWRVQDSSHVNCKFSHVLEPGKPERDSVVILTNYLDTLSFLETGDSLLVSNCNLFTEVFLPSRFIPVFLPQNWQNQFRTGFHGSSVNASLGRIAFPKRIFSTYGIPPKQCVYTDAGTTTACKWLGGDVTNTYHYEAMTFLEGIGFYSLNNSNATGLTDQTSSDIRLIRRISDDRTLEFTGFLTFEPVGIAHRPGSMRTSLLVSDTRIFDANGRMTLPSEALQNVPRNQPSFTRPAGR